MKMTKCTILALLALLWTQAQHVFAVTGTQLAIQGTDVVLRWPSHPGEIFIIGYRPTLDPSTPWTFLTTTLPAAVGSETTFTHSGAFQGGGGQQMAAAFGGDFAQSQRVALSAEERESRRAAARESAKKAIAFLMAQLEAAMERVKAMREERLALLRAGIQPPAAAAAQQAAAPGGGVAAAQMAPGGMGFYFVTELGEDVDGDLLPNDWELALGTSIVKADSDGDSIDDGAEDYDGDGRCNYHEIVAGTDPLVADDLITHTYLTSGTAIREEFEVELFNPPGLAAAATPAIDTQLAVYGNDGDGIGGMYARVVAPNGTVQVKFYSIFIEGGFAVAAAGAGFDLSPEELSQLGDAYGPGTRSRSGLFSTPNATKLQQIPAQTLEKAAELHSAKAKEFWIKANEPNISAATKRIRIDQVDTQVSRFNAVRRATGRAGQGLLPLAIIGGVFVAIDVYGSQQELIDAANAYHVAAVNGDDLCDPAIDVAIWANNVAPPSFNFVWDYLCP